MNLRTRFKPAAGILAVSVLLGMIFWLFPTALARGARQAESTAVPTPASPLPTAAPAIHESENAYLTMVFKPAAIPQPTPVGPLGGTFTSLAADPGQNDNLYAGSFEAGIYKSFDQGKSWYWMSYGLGNLKIQSLAAHPSNSRVVYAGTYSGGLYKSSDGGAHWIASNGGVLNGHIIYDIEINPLSPETVYLVSRLPNSLVGYLYRSLNGGQSWQLLLKGDAFPGEDYFYDVDLQPGSSLVIYLATHTHGFYKSTNGGASFWPINANITDLSARSMALDSSQPGLVYGGVWHGDGVYVSVDGGGSWQKRSAGLPLQVKIMDLSVDDFSAAPRRVFSATFGNGLYSSDNFGGAWVSRGLAGQSLNDFLIADGSPQRWYTAVQNNGIFRSSTYGSSWIGSSGALALNNVTDFQLVPGEPATLYAALYGRGVFQIDGLGTLWQEVNQGLADLQVIRLWADRAELYALTLSGVYQLRAGKWSPVALPPVESVAGVEKSAEYLALRVAERNEEINERFAQDPAAASLAGAYGLSNAWWSAAPTEQAGLAIPAGEQLRCLQDSVWVDCGSFAVPINIIADGPAGTLLAAGCEETGLCQVYQSAGQNWSALGGAYPGGEVFELATVDGQVLTANSRGLYVNDPATGEWIAAIAAEEVYTLASSPEDGCRVAAGGLGAIYLSSDCGLSWLRLPLDGFPWRFQALSFIPGEPYKLLIGSKEAGAFIIDVAQ